MPGGLLGVAKSGPLGANLNPLYDHAGQRIEKRSPVRSLTGLQK